MKTWRGSRQLACVTALTQLGTSNQVLDSSNRVLESSNRTSNRVLTRLGSSNLLVPSQVRAVTQVTRQYTLSHIITYTS